MSIVLKRMQKMLGVLSVVCVCAGMPSVMSAWNIVAPKNGMFVGIDIGWLADFTTTSDNSAGAIAKTSNDTFPYGLFAFKAGYTHYFLKYLGIRAYADYNYGFYHTYSNDGTTRTRTRDGVHHIAANVDVLFNIYTHKVVTVGAYVGLGVGYAAKNNASTTNSGTISTTTTSGPSGFYMPLNFGVSTNIERHHRLDLGCKFQTIATTAYSAYTDATTYTEDALRTLTFSLGYSYIF